MAHSDICCGLYRGTFFLKDLSSADNPLLEVGNAEATISQTLTEIEQESFQTLGGTACKVAFPKSVNLALVLHCMSPENLALAFLGDSSQLAGGQAIKELHPVNSIGELIPFNFVADKDGPIIVSDGATIPVIYVAGTDYVVTNAGIQIITGSAIPVDGSDVAVTYYYGKNYIVSAQTVGQKEFLVVLDGVNVGESGQRPVVLKAWKVKFNPTDSFALISGSNFASLNLAGEILLDTTKTTGSKYFKVEWGAKVNGLY